MGQSVDDAVGWETEDSPTLLSQMLGDADTFRLRLGEVEGLQTPLREVELGLGWIDGSYRSVFFFFQLL